MYCDVLNLVPILPILDLFYSISRKTFILYVSPRMEWIAQKISWRTFPSKANKHMTLNMGLWQKKCLKGSQKKGYIYVPSKKARAPFFLSQPWGTFNPNVWIFLVSLIQVLRPLEVDTCFPRFLLSGECRECPWKYELRSVGAIGHWKNGLTECSNSFPINTFTEQHFKHIWFQAYMMPGVAQNARCFYEKTII